MHPIADYLNIHSASAGRFSPDGREVIYLSDETGTFQVWKVGVDGAGRAQLTQDRGERVMQAVWSPTEGRILFERDAGGNERWQILSMRPDGSETEPLVESSDHIHHFGDFAPDGKSFCYYANSRDVTHFDVYVCEFESRQSRLVFEGEGLNTVEAFSPDGKAILVRKHLSNVEQELFLIDIKGGARRKITTAPARYEHCRFAPDGTVFCLSDQGRDFLGVAQISPAKAALSWVVAEEWDVDLLDVASDGTIIAYALNRDGLSELVVKEVATGDEIELPEVGPWVITDLRFSLDGKTIAVSHHHATVNPNVTVIDLEAVAATQVTDASLATIDPAGFVAPELVRYPTFDGRTIPCFVSIPRVPPPAGGYPVIVDIHGGPESQRRPEFFAHFQYYLAQGYAVFSPNVRGSTGYGRAFQALDDVRRREDSVKDIGALFDFIRQDKRANPARVGLYGASYGGFMALAAAAAFPEHWAAAVDVVGVVNFRTFLEHTAPWRRRYRENEYGSLEADGEFLDGLSPIHHVDRISCPLLIIHGRNDSRVPVSEAEQLAAAVRKLGRVAELVIYPDEGHGITKRVNRLDCYPRVANFFKIWVFEGKKAPAPKPPQPPPVPAQPSLVVADGGRKPAVSAPPAAPGEERRSAPLPTPAAAPGVAAATAAVAPAPAPPAPAVTPTQTPASEMVAESVAESPAAPASLPAASGEPAPPAPAGGQKAADAVPRRPKPRAKAKAVAAADAEPKGEAEPTVDVAATPAEPVEATEPDARGAEPDPKVDPADAIQMIGWAEARQPGFPYALELQAFYNAHHHHFMVDRAQYARPGAANPGRHPRRERARIEQLVAARAPLAEQGLDKATFNAVMEWGFCRTLPIEEAFLVEVTQDAFRRAAAGDGAGALDDLLSLPLFSIARASLVLAVADPERFAVYDHRVATALSGLRADGKRLFPVPPGRARHCDLLSKAGFVAAYGRYLQAMDLLAEQYRRQHDRPWRVADVEMALSQMGARGVALEGGLAGDPPAEPYGASCFTLGRGAQARRFQATLSTEGIHLKAGEEQVRFDWALIDELVAAKGGQEIAVGAVQKVPADNTLALFLRDHAIDHKWASHLAALLVEAGDARSFRYGGDRMTRLYVRIKEAGEN